MNPTLSFIIPTSGSRKASLAKLCRDIRSTVEMPQEIILAGKVEEFAAVADELIDMPLEAETGMICHMRNAGGEMARGSVLIFMDDDIELHEGWADAITPLFTRIMDKRADAGSCRIVGPNGGRWYDWCAASRSDPECPSILVPYNEQHDSLYVSGCCLIVSAEAYQKTRFNESLLNHQHDDVDFCHRLLDAGYRFSCQPKAVLTHLMLPAGRNPEDPAAGPEKFAEAIYLYRQGKLPEATELLEEAVNDINPEIYHYYKGLFALFSRDYQGAEEQFSNSLDCETTNRAVAAQALYRLSMVNLLTGRKEKARGFLHQVLQIIPDHPFAKARLKRLGQSK